MNLISYRKGIYTLANAPSSSSYILVILEDGRAIPLGDGLTSAVFGSSTSSRECSSTVGFLEGGSSTCSGSTLVCSSVVFLEGGSSTSSAAGAGVTSSSLLGVGVGRFFRGGAARLGPVNFAEEADDAEGVGDLESSGGDWTGVVSSVS